MYTSFSKRYNYYVYSYSLMNVGDSRKLSAVLWMLVVLWYPIAVLVCHISTEGRVTLAWAHRSVLRSDTICLFLWLQYTCCLDERFRRFRLKTHGNNKHDRKLLKLLLTVIFSVVFCSLWVEYLQYKLALFILLLLLLNYCCNITTTTANTTSCSYHSYYYYCNY